MIRAFAKDLLIYLPARIVPAIVGLIAIPLITRLFSPAEFGNYILVITTVAVLSVIVGWIPSSIIRFYATCKQERLLRELYGAVAFWIFVTVTVLTFLYVGALLLGHASMEPKLYHLMFIGVAIFVLRALCFVLMSFLRVERRVGLYTSLYAGYFVAGLGIGIALVLFLEFGVAGLLWGNVISLVLIIPLLWKAAHVEFTWGNFGSPTLTREIARYGFPLILGELAIWILSLSDRYIIQFFRGTYEVGVYSANYMVSEQSILVLVYLIFLAAGPIAMDVWAKEGEAKSQAFIAQLTRYYLAICLPAVIGLGALAEPIISIFTAAEYHRGFRIIYFISFGVFFFGLQSTFSIGLLFHKRTKLITINFMGAVLLNLLLNFLLVPRYGYMAAAVTTLVSYGFLLTTMIIVSRKYFIWEFPGKSLVRVTLASAIMGGAVYFFDNSLNFAPVVNLIINIPLGVGVYLSLLFLLGEIQPNEKQVLKQLYQQYISRESS